MGTGGGAMTDAPKRLRGHSPELPDNAPPASSYMATQAMPPPFPSDIPHQELAGLPPGVSSLEMWGSTLISFGKYKDKMTYVELLTASDSETAFGPSSQSVIPGTDCSRTVRS